MVCHPWSRSPRPRSVPYWRTRAELITGVERNRLIETCEHDAFHLELRDDYSVPDEDGPFESWLRDEPVDYAFMKPWTQMVKRLTGEGRAVRRVRVVSHPHTPYIRWEHRTTPRNVEAGEDIRWLARHTVPGELVFPFDGKDWWLMDDRLLAVGHTVAGRVRGHEIIDDPKGIAEARSAMPCGPSPSHTANTDPDVMLRANGGRTDDEGRHPGQGRRPSHLS
ncbi:DUF6879 family protein [Streptomyces qinglanensis]|uniref:DUF6879 domain-containing protein n=1 Tax=Streptomyces qinglanensis TaxID=943816 RepID=A0A1H9NLC7_9ACTN|nr:DUF6879 family protein [Streptomyces qinglanensis]SER36740.1 hypothetical protein SAMN05421870_101486 [Streptomyces qinglanensis]